MSSGAGDQSRGAIKTDKIDRMTVNHCCVFGRPLAGAMLLHYLLLSALYGAVNVHTAFMKACEDVNESEPSTELIWVGVCWIISS